MDDILSKLVVVGSDPGIFRVEEICVRSEGTMIVFTNTKTGEQLELPVKTVEIDTRNVSEQLHRVIYNTHIFFKKGGLVQAKFHTAPNRGDGYEQTLSVTF